MAATRSVHLRPGIGNRQICGSFGLSAIVVKLQLITSLNLVDDAPRTLALQPMTRLSRRRPPLARLIVASIIPGAISSDRVRQDVDCCRVPIPASLSLDLRCEGPIWRDAPTRNEMGELVVD